MSYYEPADIAIYVEGKGVVLKEKSLMAVDAISEKILAFGTEAERMAENPSDHVRIISPMRRGMIEDYNVTVKLFRCLLYKAWEKKPLRKPVIVISAPKGITEVGKIALKDAVYQIGAGNVFIFETEMNAEQLAQSLRQSDDKALKKFHTIIEITKDEPEKYIREALAELLQYAQQEGISKERIRELLEE